MSLQDRWNWGLSSDHAVDMIEPYVSDRVLDIGCGYGRITKALARRRPNWTLIGYDPEPSALSVATKDSLPNESYVNEWTNDFDSAFALLVFQHLPDEEVSGIIRRVYPRPLRFQYVVGRIEHDWNYQRTEGQLEGICEDVGYRIKSESDPIYDEWRWVHAC